MKINFENDVIGTPINNINVGETFFIQRKSVEEIGLYMKIDGGSGLVRYRRGCSYAINLANGQLREFESDICVEKVIAEVNFPKK